MNSHENLQHKNFSLWINYAKEITLSNQQLKIKEIHILLIQKVNMEWNSLQSFKNSPSGNNSPDARKLIFVNECISWVRSNIYTLGNIKKSKSYINWKYLFLIFYII
jgi:hypothetical protein